MAPDPRIPVHVITGFLGSGKTTLLKRLLADPALGDTAVLINEFGEVGLDHLLLERVDGETVVLQSGCLCCSVREDMAEAIRRLMRRRAAGAIPPFHRLVIETTGVADPVPVLMTIAADPMLRHQMRVGSVVTTVDGVNGTATLAGQAESVKQVGIADRLVLTKCDLADPAPVDGLARALQRLNPAAELLRLPGQAIDAAALLADAADPDRREREVARWIAAAERLDGAPGDHHHGHDLASFVVTLDEPLDWGAFGLWLTLLLHAHGERLLRVKGILSVAGSDTPVAIHGAQHLVHAPIHLGRWPDGARRSRLVFIGRGLDAARIRDSLAAFHRMSLRRAA